MVYVRRHHGWARKYVQCVQCGTTSVRHEARGLCLDCYRRRPEAKTYGRDWNHTAKGKVSRKRYAQSAAGKAVRKKSDATPSRRADRRMRIHLRRALAANSDMTPRLERELRATRTFCPLCRKRMVEEPHAPRSKQLDHIVPVNVGGTHTLGNVRIICATCNNRRPRDGSDYAGQTTLWSRQ